jgi:hypothetical protein
MRNFYACTLLVISAALAWAEGPTLKEARQRWLHGNYEEARSLYETLAQDAKRTILATVTDESQFLTLWNHSKKTMSRT